MNNELSYKEKDLGLVIISPTMSDLAIGLYDTFANNSKDMPMIGYSTTVASLSSIVSFPMFSRVCLSDPYSAEIIALMVKFFE